MGKSWEKIFWIASYEPAGQGAKNPIFELVFNWETFQIKYNIWIIIVLFWSIYDFRVIFLKDFVMQK